MINTEYKEAIVEVLGIIQYLEEDDRNKIPNEVMEFFENNKSDTYHPDIKYEQNVNDLKLKNKTREILAGLYLDYLCQENEKTEYVNRLRKNEIRNQQELKEKYDVDNIFKNKTIEHKIEVQTLVVKQKESFLIKLINKIKQILKITK